MAIFLDTEMAKTEHGLRPIGGIVTVCCDRCHPAQRQRAVSYERNGPAIESIVMPPDRWGPSRWKIDLSPGGEDLCPDCNDPRCTICGAPVKPGTRRDTEGRMLCSGATCTPF